MTPANLLDLIGRLEAATGPDRGIDQDIYHELGLCGDKTRTDGYCADYKAPEYSRSIDAALTLRDRDNWPVCQIIDLGPVMGWSVRLAVFDTSGAEPVPIMRDGKSQSVAIALCIAALKSRFP